MPTAAEEKTLEGQSRKGEKSGVDNLSDLAKLLSLFMAKPKTADFKAQAQMFKALAHPGRLLMLDELSRGERCVCELAALVGSEMPTISRHLAQLRNAGIVEDEKRGAQVFYRLVTPCVMNFFQCVTSVRETSRK
jgi:DNA-binding transcriptional ArsR family regulator